MYSLIMPEEAAVNERLRQAPRRRCAACGSKLNRYAAASRMLCSLCLSHDTEARLLVARRRMAGRRAITGQQTSLELQGALADIEEEALHVGLWRLAVAELADDFRVIPAGGDGGGRGLGILFEEEVGTPRTLVASRERMRRIWYSDEEENRDPDALSDLIEAGYLVREGYAAWDGIATLYEVWRLYPRLRDQLGIPLR